VEATLKTVEELLSGHVIAIALVISVVFISEAFPGGITGRQFQ
jgi:multidrug efflux pump subunit AcrB